MDKLVRELIDIEANKIKKKMAEPANLFGEPFDKEDINSLIMAAYAIGRKEAQADADRFLEIFTGH